MALGLEGANLSEQSRALLRLEIAQAEQRYSSGEMLDVPADCLAGLEINYDLSEREADVDLSGREYRRTFGYSRYTARRNRQNLRVHSREEIRRDIAQLRPQAADEISVQADWLEQVDQLTLPEIVTYFAYRELSEASLTRRSGLDHVGRPTAPILEFRFGRAPYQEGYYDSPGSFEARTVPRTPSEAMACYDEVSRVFSSYARACGLQFSITNCQVNLSINNRDGTALHDLRSPQGQEVARRTTTGMLLALRDVAPLMLPVMQYPGAPQYLINAGPKRSNNLRVLPDRFEGRVTRGDWIVPEATVLAMLGGFAVGASVTAAPLAPEDAWVAAEIIPAPHYARSKDFDPLTDLQILRSLQHSDLTPDGYSMLDPNYAEIRYRQILGAFFGSPNVEGRAFTAGIRDAERLLATIHTDVDQRFLSFDIERLAAWWEGLPNATRNAISGETPHRHGLRVELLEQRLRKVLCIGQMDTVQSGTLLESITPASWHDTVARLAGSTILRSVMSADTLAAIATELGGLFTPEQALAHEAMLRRMAKRKF